jgi:hypothetical protein
MEFTPEAVRRIGLFYPLRFGQNDRAKAAGWTLCSLLQRCTNRWREQTKVDHYMTRSSGDGLGNGKQNQCPKYSQDSGGRDSSITSGNSASAAQIACSITRVYITSC